MVDRCAVTGHPCIGCRPGPCHSRVKAVDVESRKNMPRYKGEWGNTLDHKAMATEVILLDEKAFSVINNPVNIVAAVKEFEEVLNKKRRDRDVLNELISKIKKWRDKAIETPCAGLKEEVVLNRVLGELNELQTNMEIRDRILRENLEMVIGNYFIMHIQNGNNELDPVDTNADIQKLIRECLDFDKTSL